MSQEKPIQYGVTAPISTDPPTEHELKLTEDLLETLKSYGLFESEQEAQKRVVVLGKLNKLVKEFVYKVSKMKGFPDSLAREAGGKIFTYGSYRLGVHGAGADIDTLCVFPKHVQREDFFTIMYDMLKERPEVTEISAVPDAYVPVIKMHFSGIPIDFICARLAVARVPDNLELADNNILKNLDERCVRSLNGSRVTDDILRLVPNVNTFRIALRTIKLWAKSKAIYSNVMGFLGGVAWAMLTARICQLYPNACAASIVNRFFLIMYQWKWPQPVLLRPLEDGPLQVRVWNPKLYPADRSHRMPIITPAYPSMCATHNVTESTRKIMIQEFKNGIDIASNIIFGTGKWSDLFVKSDFFHQYKHYLQITSASHSSEAQLMWSGLVEAKLRQLVLKLEVVDMIELAHPYVKGFDKVHYCLTEKEVEDAMKGVLLKDRSISVEEGSLEIDHTELLKEKKVITEDDVKNIKKVYTTTFYIGLEISKPKVGGESNDNNETAAADSGRKLNLVWPAQEFQKVVKAWDKYDEEQMKISITTIKRSKLPSELTTQDDGKKTTISSPEKRKNGPSELDSPAKKIRVTKTPDEVQASAVKETVVNATASTVE